MPSCQLWLIKVILLVAFLASSSEGVDKSLEELVRKSELVQKRIDSSEKGWLPRITRKRSSKQTRGIVIAAGGPDQLANALASVQIIRHSLHCKLPIEVGYYGKEEAVPALMSALEKITAVKTIDVSKYRKRNDAPVKNGYLKKILAIYHCSFDQFLYLDADNTPLQDPSNLFEWPVFKTEGNVFWPDYMGPGRHESAKPEIYEAFNLTVPWTPQHDFHRRRDWKCTESGQFLFNRKKHADVLEWILFLNAEHETVYNYVYGDKDSFELAFHISGKGSAYRRIPYGPRASFRHMPETNAKGEPLFFHQVAGGKFFLKQENLSVPEYITLGITEQALDTMQWWNKYGTLRLGKENSIQPNDIKCENLDRMTADLFGRIKLGRWRACAGRSWGVPIPLIPISTFPSHVDKIVSALLANFQLIQEKWSSAYIGVN